MNFNELDNVKIITTNETGIIVDKYKMEDTYYFQVELDNKKENRDVVEVSEKDIEKNHSIKIYLNMVSL